MDDETRVRGAGGTSGGIGEFFLGLIMAVAGAYLLTNRVMVVSSFWSIWGYSGFGLTLVPLIIGIGILFFNGKSIAGWLLRVINASTRIRHHHDWRRLGRLVFCQSYG